MRKLVLATMTFLVVSSNAGAQDCSDAQIRSVGASYGQDVGRSILPSSSTPKFLEAMASLNRCTDQYLVGHELGKNTFGFSNVFLNGEAIAKVCSSSDDFAYGLMIGLIDSMRGHLPSAVSIPRTLRAISTCHPGIDFSKHVKPSLIVVAQDIKDNVKPSGSKTVVLSLIEELLDTTR